MINYRIPAYQVAAALTIFFAAIWWVNSRDASQLIVEGNGEYSTYITHHNIGRTAQEDSLLISKFVVSL